MNYDASILQNSLFEENPIDEPENSLIVDTFPETAVNNETNTTTTTSSSSSTTATTTTIENHLNHHQQIGKKNEKSSKPHQAHQVNTTTIADAMNIERRVSFPKDDKALITGYMEPVNPWSKVPPVTDSFELAKLYRDSCAKHKTVPINYIIEHVKSLNLNNFIRQPLLNLRNHKLTAESCEALEEILKRVQYKVIDLTDCGLDDSSAPPIFDIIEYYEATNELNLSDNCHIKNRGWQSCISMVKRSHALESLTLTGTYISESNVINLGGSLDTSSLHTIRLDKCNLSGRQMESFCNYLKKNTNIREIGLANNSLCDGDAFHLGVVLKQNLYLQYLDISNNRISNIGVAYITEALIEQQHLLNKLYQINNVVSASSSSTYDTNKHEEQNIAANCCLTPNKNKMDINNEIVEVPIQSTAASIGRSMLNTLLQTNRPSDERVKIAECSDSSINQFDDENNMNIIELPFSPMVRSSSSSASMINKDEDSIEISLELTPPPTPILRDQPDINILTSNDTIISNKIHDDFISFTTNEDKNEVISELIKINENTDLNSSSILMDNKIIITSTTTSPSSLLQNIPSISFEQSYHQSTPSVVTTTTELINPNSSSVLSSVHQESTPAPICKESKIIESNSASPSICKESKIIESNPASPSPSEIISSNEMPSITNTNANTNTNNNKFTNNPPNTILNSQITNIIVKPERSFSSESLNSQSSVDSNDSKSSIKLIETKFSKNGTLERQISNQIPKMSGKGGQQPTGLQVLIFWNNNITNDSAISFSNLFKTTTTLEVLNIGRNQLRNPFLSTIKSQLKTNSSLTNLGLQSTRLTCNSAKTVAEIIEFGGNKTLQRIDLRNNDIRVDGLTSLNDAMKSNQSITRIDLDDQPCRSHEMDASILMEYNHMLSSIRNKCTVNNNPPVTEPTVHDSSGNSQQVRKNYLASRKISLTCCAIDQTTTSTSTIKNPINLDASFLDVISNKKFNTAGGRLRSPLPSPIPSPLLSPIPSPSRSRFHVSRVAESSLLVTPIPIQSAATAAETAAPPSCSVSLDSVAGHYFPTPRFRISSVEAAAAAAAAAPTDLSKQSLPESHSILTSIGNHQKPPAAAAATTETKTPIINTEIDKSIIECEKLTTTKHPIVKCNDPLSSSSYSINSDLEVKPLTNEQGGSHTSNDLCPVIDIQNNNNNNNNNRDNEYDIKKTPSESDVSKNIMAFNKLSNNTIKACDNIGPMRLATFTTPPSTSSIIIIETPKIDSNKSSSSTNSRTSSSSSTSNEIHLDKNDKMVIEEDKRIRKSSWISQSLTRVGRGNDGGNGNTTSGGGGGYPATLDKLLSIFQHPGNFFTRNSDIQSNTLKKDNELSSSSSSSSHSEDNLKLLGKREKSSLTSYLSWSNVKSPITSEWSSTSSSSTSTSTSSSSSTSGNIENCKPNHNNNNTNNNNNNNTNNNNNNINNSPLDHNKKLLSEKIPFQPSVSPENTMINKNNGTGTDTVVVTAELIPSALIREVKENISPENTITSASVTNLFPYNTKQCADNHSQSKMVSLLGQQQQQQPQQQQLQQEGLPPKQEGLTPKQEGLPSKQEGLPPPNELLLPTDNLINFEQNELEVVDKPEGLGDDGHDANKYISTANVSTTSTITTTTTSPSSPSSPSINKSILCITDNNLEENLDNPLRLSENCENANLTTQKNNNIISVESMTVLKTNENHDDDDGDDDINNVCCNTFAFKHS